MRSRYSIGKVIRQSRPLDGIVLGVDHPQRDVEGAERSFLVLEAASEDVPVRVGNAQVDVRRCPVRGLTLRRPRRERGLE